MTALQKYSLYIDGAERPPASGEWFETFNPFTGKKSVWISTAEDVPNPFIMR